MLISIIAFMAVGTLFWGSNLGWRQVLIFWAALLPGGLIVANVFHMPRFATLYMGAIALWFVCKAATSRTSML
jgi:hypothetical protein